MADMKWLGVSAQHTQPGKVKVYGYTRVGGREAVSGDSEHMQWLTCLNFGPYSSRQTANKGKVIKKKNLLK